MTKELAALHVLLAAGFDRADEADIQATIAFLDTLAEGKRIGKNHEERCRAAVEAANAIYIATGRLGDVVDPDEYLKWKEAKAQ